jgi:hypothetical protein
MHTISLLLLSVFLSCPGFAGQTTPTDSNTLRAILDEVHKLRQDLQATCFLPALRSLRNHEAECANQLRVEQGQLGQLQDQLDRLDRKLEYALRQPAEAPQVSAQR